MTLRHSRRAIATRFPSCSALFKRVWHCSRLIGQVVNWAYNLDHSASIPISNLAGFGTNFWLDPRLAFYLAYRSGDGDLSLQSKATSRLRRYKEFTVHYALWGGIFTNSYPEPLAPSAPMLSIPSTSAARNFRIGKVIRLVWVECYKFLLTLQILKSATLIQYTIKGRFMSR